MPALLVIAVGGVVAVGAVWLASHRRPVAVTVRPPPPGPATGKTYPGAIPLNDLPASPLKTRASSGVVGKPLKSEGAFQTSPSSGSVVIGPPPPAAPTLKDVAAARETAGYKAYQYPLLASMGHAVDYANGIASPALSANGGQYANMKLDNETALLKSLGWTLPQLKSLAGQLSEVEWEDFWLLGVVPNRFAPGVPGTDTIGGWHSPYVGSVLAYGNDGGQWNAVLTFWKTGAQQVIGLIPFIGGAASSALGQVKIDAYGNKHGGGNGRTK